MVNLEWVLGSLFALIIGGYGFTWAVHNALRLTYKEFQGELNDLKNNEIKHLQERVTVLEQKEI